MTKKIIIIFALMMAVSTSFAQSPGGNGNGGGHLPFIIKPTNPGSPGNKPIKSPIQVPYVYQDGNTLSFDASIEGCTVLLLDENENVVFSDLIVENQTSLVLPSYLTGTFELQIICGNITFYCYIEL